jgi:hypothetical protein
MQIRYHLDESVSRAVAIGLRQRGIDVTTSIDAGLLGVSDEKQLEYASRHDRLAVTHDDDFLRFQAAGLSHAGIAYCHQRDRTIGQIVLSLANLWRTESAEDVRGRVVFL